LTEYGLNLDVRVIHTACNLIDDILPNVILHAEMFLAISGNCVHLEMLMNKSIAEPSDPGLPALYRVYIGHPNSFVKKFALQTASDKVW